MQFTPQNPDEATLLADALMVAAQEYRKKAVALEQAGEARSVEVRTKAETLLAWQASLPFMPLASALPKSPTES